MKDQHPSYRRPKPLVAALLSAFLVSACGSSSNDDDEHAHTHIESSGRLAVYDTTAQALKVIDLDNGSELASLPLTGAVPSLYPVPGNRYTAVIQRNDNLVSFLDGGLYTEGHGDHLHDYAETPTLLDFTLDGVRPTHYEPGAEYAVLFNDGLADPVTVASVSVFSAASIAAGGTDLELNLENNMHGVAKLIDDQLFVTYRDPSITDTTLPAEVERYSIDNGVATFETRYDEQCPLLHGAGYNHEVLVFGCGDGVLSIDLTSPDYPATKLGNPESMNEGSRIGSVFAHHDVETLVTKAGNQLFALNIEAGEASYQQLTLPEGVTALKQDFTPNGEFFWALGSNGHLLLWESNGDWGAAPQSLAVTSTAPTSAGMVFIAASMSEHFVYVLDVTNQRIHEVDYEAGRVTRQFPLGFAASGLSWMGLPDHDHDHDHE